MNPRPVPASPDVTTLVDDFEWPPKTDEVSIHEIAAEPWRTAKKAARPADPIAVTVTVSIDDADPPAAPPEPSGPPAPPRPAIWRRDR